ncbi:hypothetical protein SAMN06295912_12515 [Sphingomonas laterariae]|uniref:Uncharacterized protein n=1 Tax=Edaphosphingomonas laterariae TaxID=861865 RepID=A0A239IJ58_9SPHN|nr:hypothetical protein [Sphingomonas laterariae]SNS93796.1 hypothetical protein SAMN06295912_12515 [Sphingomonas laterariae]
MKMTAIIALGFVAVAALPGAASAKEKADNLVVKAGAQPLNCVNLRQIRETKVLNDSTIDFHMNGGKIYRNSLPGRCPQLGFEERFAYKTSLSQLCSTDIITVLTTMGGPGLNRGASCGLGQFQEMEAKK